MKRTLLCLAAVGLSTVPALAQFRVGLEYRDADFQLDLPAAPEVTADTSLATLGYEIDLQNGLSLVPTVAIVGDFSFSGGSFDTIGFGLGGRLEYDVASFETGSVFGFGSLSYLDFEAEDFTSTSEIQDLSVGAGVGYRGFVANQISFVSSLSYLSSVDNEITFRDNQGFTFFGPNGQTNEYSQDGFALELGISYDL